MKAAILPAFGPAENFVIEDRPDPVAGPGELVLKVAATSVNPIDIRIRDIGPPFAPALPGILHGDVAGSVIAVGDGVTDFAVGDAVVGCAGGVKGYAGALAEKMPVKAAHVVKAPTAIPLEESGALPIIGITAWQALFDRGNLQAGEHVLIHAGLGGVGHMAVQLAKRAGARVATTVSSEEKAAIARDLGADDIIFYKDEGVDDYVARLTEGGKGFDLVFDTVGGAVLDQSMQAARPGGRLVNIQARSTHDLSPVHLKGLSLHVVFMILPLIHGTDPAPMTNAMAEVVKAIDEGALKPLIHQQRFALDDVAAAHACQQSGANLGKVLICP